MRRSHRQSNAAHAERLSHLAAAFAASRRANPGRRFPRGLRAQVVAALDAGASASAVARTCSLSWAQVTRWRSAAARGVPAPSPAASAATTLEPRVLSVVDAGAHERAASDEDIEIRVGQWRVSLSRAVD
jgi:hypothetical protein